MDNIEFNPFRISIADAMKVSMKERKSLLVGIDPKYTDESVAKGLAKQYSISIESAQAIVQATLIKFNSESEYTQFGIVFDSLDEIPFGKGLYHARKLAQVC